MKLRPSTIAGMLVGYYMGARAGRAQYDRINRAFRKAIDSPLASSLRDRARSAVDRKPIARDEPGGFDYRKNHDEALAYASGPGTAGHSVDS